jgi:hypothetical protein
MKTNKKKTDKKKTPKLTINDIIWILRSW